jgi:hypothetical protein
MFERCYAEWLAKADEEDDAALDAEEEAAIDEAVDEALHRVQSVVIPPIMIPVVKMRAKRANPTTPTPPTFWDGVSEEMALKLCESSYYDWDVVDQAWFQEHKHLIA